MRTGKKILALLLFAALAHGLSAQRIFQVKGAVFEGDSSKAIPFAYVINLSTQHGVVADLHGRFTIAAGANDSLQLACIGFQKIIVRVNSLPNENDSVKAFKKYYLKRTVYELSTVYVNTFKIKPNEREYMKRVIERPKVRGINVVESPITALWQNFSRKGREMQKLEKIFEDLLRKEEIEKKLNTDLLRKLLDDESITLEQYRIICPEITDDFILSTSGYELYSQVTSSYRSWKKRTKSSQK